MYPSPRIDRLPARPESPMAGAVSSPAARWLLGGVFALLLGLPALLEFTGRTSSLPGSIRSDSRRFGIQVALNEIERHLVYDSKFANLARRPYQVLLIDRLRQGSRRVLIGHDRFWFHRDDVLGVAGDGILSSTYTTPQPRRQDIVEEATAALMRAVRGVAAPPPSHPAAPAAALEVLSALSASISARGVRVVIAVVPGKLAIYPERLKPSYPAGAGAALNRDFVRFIEALRGRGVDVVDLTPAFWGARESARLFLEHDSHWTPEGVELGARTLAAHLRDRLPPAGAPLPELDVRATEPTDLATVLGFRPDDPMAAGAPMALRALANPSASPAQGAPVLLFGDSLSGYYEDRHAGLPSRLSANLRLPVRSVIGYGADLPIAIERAFRQEPDLLDGVQAVVVEFHMSQLYSRTFSSVLSLEATP